MKRIVRTVCTGCHTASYPLQTGSWERLGMS